LWATLAASTGSLCTSEYEGPQVLVGPQVPHHQLPDLLDVGCRQRLACLDHQVRRGRSTVPDERTWTLTRIPDGAAHDVDERRSVLTSGAVT
jgi:hypothetical protein